MKYVDKYTEKKVPQSRSKTCIPGLFCIENMTMFLLFVVVFFLAYLYYAYFAKLANALPTDGFSRGYIKPEPSVIFISNPPVSPLVGVSTRNDPIDNPYYPPVKTDDLYYPRDGTEVRGIPVNVSSRGFSSNYSQMGILTRNGKGDLILPLMGRRASNGKKNYYTMSNTGNINTKLPLSVNGKSCTSEYGCEEISDGDIVYVEGYNDTFRATIYENGLFSYIPFL
jgi:hypothetical protein